MYLIQLLLPLHHNEKQAFPADYFDIVRRTLTARFGGVTAFLRSPAVGLWKEGGDELTDDDVVMFEVISSELDSDWWTGYRIELQNKFRRTNSSFGPPRSQGSESLRAKSIFKLGILLAENVKLAENRSG